MSLRHDDHAVAIAHDEVAGIDRNLAERERQPDLAGCANFALITTRAGSSIM